MSKLPAIPRNVARAVGDKPAVPDIFAWINVVIPKLVFPAALPVVLVPSLVVEVPSLAPMAVLLGPKIVIPKPAAPLAPGPTRVVD